MAHKLPWQEDSDDGDYTGDQNGGEESGGESDESFQREVEERERKFREEKREREEQEAREREEEEEKPRRGRLRKKGAAAVSSEEEGTPSHWTRARKKVNYNEDALMADLDEEIHEEEGEDGPPKEEKIDASENNDKDFVAGEEVADDDDEFVAGDEDDDDEYLDGRPRRRRVSRGPKFVVDDDEAVNEDGEFRPEKRRQMDDEDEFGAVKKRKRGRPRKNEVVVDDEDDEPHVSAVQGLEDELQALKEDSGPNSPLRSQEESTEDGESPVHRNLRRRKNVNYKLPPPVLTDAQIEQLNANYGSSPRRRGGRYGGMAAQNGHVSHTVRRLFPTVGPFGGSEVTPLFGGGGIPPNVAALGNVSSSDSDDDNELYRATDPTSGAIIPSGAPNAKKRNTLADTDPLGIDTNIDFSAVGGLDKYIDQLKEMITLPLLYPELYTRFHITPPRGVLFHGPPGTGKTLMARALAASCSSQGKKITFFMRKGADCLSKWVGEAERHLRLLFEEAKQKQPSIIFFDEIDGLAPVRSSKQEQIHASIVSTMLALMDGMDNRGQVVVIGATNRPDSVDPALRRPGRFDREFYFPLPDEDARKQILRIHTRKWKCQPSDAFLAQLAAKTSGYGGADLRALCTESALNAIQRAYPEIYGSTDKLEIDTETVNVAPADFIRALGKIVPSSARSAGAGNTGTALPASLRPLLQSQVDRVVASIDASFPREKKMSPLEEAQYEDLAAFDENGLPRADGGFLQRQLVQRLEAQRVFRPRLVVSALPGQGLHYVCSAALERFEGVTIRTLDYASLFGDGLLTPETAVVQMFQELKRRPPAVLFIPDIAGFAAKVSASVTAAISDLLRAIPAEEKIMIIGGMTEGAQSAEDAQDSLAVFGIGPDNFVRLSDPADSERAEYFSDVWKGLSMNPYDFNDVGSRPKRRMRQLKKAEPIKALTSSSSPPKSSHEEKQQARHDLRLKNILKVKLAVLMDGFKVRYKRFKKPVVDDAYLIHLFEAVPDPNAPFQQEGNMIKEVASGRLFYNIDLEVIEERLWNGYYSEPKQFLQDIELIVADAKTTGEKERIWKASEMYANAQVSVEDMEALQPKVAQEWKEMRAREKKQIAAAQASVVSSSHGQQQAQQQLLPGIEMATEGGSEDVGEVVNGDVDKGDKGEVDKTEVENADKGEVEKSDKTEAEKLDKTEVEKSDKPADSQPQIDVDMDKLPEPSSALIVPPSIPPPPKVILDNTILTALKTHLLDKTRGARLDSLEQLKSRLIGIVWTHRLNPDKSGALAEMDAVLSGM